MVKIAISGASGNVARELLDVLIATQKHEIILLSTKDVPADANVARTTWIKVNYENATQLAQALQGVHTLLCFITTQSDPGNAAQKNLIDAAVKAGVKRYAPSEWATSSFDYMPWYSGKAEIRQYLEQLNKDGKVLEYCLFQVGIFVNYFASPNKTSKHIHTPQTQFDFHKRRAILLEGADDARISLITTQDFCAVVASAVEYEGEWPVVGGIQGDELTVAQLIAIGERIRGPFAIEKVQAEDLKAGVVRSSWLPNFDHPAIPADQVEKLASGMVAGILLGISAGAMSVSQEWNKLLPDYKFTRAEDFLSEIWNGLNV
ncbi:NmrA-like family protein [Colletotrichum truncatum]|uniref:NmrA-like family protein n=1 Tax=Colletotrichum truncatum TaxID=5467 RepID=A0ACC3YLA0_COLTU|nr:NmrA-like family protein [Colletotrichum truncatum]KAF6797211.1 NmrA-like family protein [Colletotrichum truncatum]